MAKSNGKRSWDKYVGSKGASGSSQANIPWFLKCFLLGTCSHHVLEPPTALFNEPSDPLFSFAWAKVVH
ncbi:unnamed protein product [Prunus armeniaca]